MNRCKEERIAKYQKKKKTKIAIRNVILFVLFVSTIIIFIGVLVQPTLLNEPTKRIQAEKDTGRVMVKMQREASKTYINGFRTFQEAAWQEMQHLATTNRVIAHRGASYDYPQNTIPAFENTAGYWGVETDVYPTKDEQWVCLHDSNVGSYSKKSQEVMNMTLAEVQQLKIKNNYYANITFPTLAEFLAICKKNNSVPIIEIKDWRADIDFQSLIETIRQADMENTAMISSFHLKALQKIRALSPTVAMLYLTKTNPTATIQDAKTIEPVSIGIGYQQLSTDLVTKAHDANMMVFAWTPTKLINILKAKSFKIDGIITNRAMDENLRKMYFNW